MLYWRRRKIVWTAFVTRSTESCDQTKTYPSCCRIWGHFNRYMLQDFDQRIDTNAGKNDGSSTELEPGQAGNGQHQTPPLEYTVSVHSQNPPSALDGDTLPGAYQDDRPASQDQPRPLQDQVKDQPSKSCSVDQESIGMSVAAMMPFR